MDQLAKKMSERLAAEDVAGVDDVIGQMVRAAMVFAAFEPAAPTRRRPRRTGGRGGARRDNAGGFAATGC